MGASGYKKSIDDTYPISEEIGDFVHLILAFCNKTGTDYEKEVRNTIKKRDKQS